MGKEGKENREEIREENTERDTISIADRNEKKNKDTGEKRGEKGEE